MEGGRSSPLRGAGGGRELQVARQEVGVEVGLQDPLDAQALGRRLSAKELGVPAAAFQYKFTLGSWNNVEETSSCGYVNDRTFGFDTADQTYTANDTVAGWEGVGSC